MINAANVKQVFQEMVVLVEITMSAFCLPTTATGSQHAPTAMALTYVAVNLDILATVSTARVMVRARELPVTTMPIACHSTTVRTQRRSADVNQATLARELFVAI